MQCEYCKKNFSSTSTLNRHLRIAKKCTKIREEIQLKKSCIHCNKELSTKQRLDTHMKICKYKDKDKNENTLVKTEQKINELKNIVKTLESDIEIIKQDKDSKILKLTIEKEENTEIGYNYLIEHVTLNQSVFKTGMSIQYPNNQIERLKRG